MQATLNFEKRLTRAPNVKLELKTIWLTRIKNKDRPKAKHQNKLFQEHYLPGLDILAGDHFVEVDA